MSGPHNGGPAAEMTLRDAIALGVLPTVIEVLARTGDTLGFRSVARASYDFADAMLAARQPRGQVVDATPLKVEVEPKPYECDGGDCGEPCPTCGVAYGARCSPEDCPGGKRVCVCKEPRR